MIKKYITRNIAENLESALEQFRSIYEDFEKWH